ncbi:DUF2637 domain-containing protein [Saccharopolyspora shandongensis]|uniref:DUF2637 domain-containing protein n=1 Tax=Saccharopolyspora shandongensis TaxID=418495 RepID=UPI0033FE15B2
MRLLPSFTAKNHPPARQHTSATDEHQMAALVEAEIRAADAELDRDLRRQRADLELTEARDQIQQRSAQRHASADLRTKQAKRAIKRRTKRAKRRARRQWWDEAKARFTAALGGRLVAVLVAMAAGTAWYGQFRYLNGPAPKGLELLLPFALAGATALEVLGLAMGTVVRAAGAHRDWALRARLLMWAVIGFSAWSNWTHNGVVMAALSMAGPTAWEIHEWWQRRARLHDQGLLRARPVRPRFPVDQWLLFFRWTLAAHKVAVRDRIENADTALSVAATERQEAKSRRWLRRNAKTWGPAVQTMVAASRAAEAERADRVLREAQGVLDAAALVWGPEALREAAEPAVQQQPPAEVTTDQRDDRPRRWFRFGRRRSQPTGTRPTEPKGAADARHAQPTGKADRQPTPAPAAPGDRKPTGKAAAATTGQRSRPARGTTDRGDRHGPFRVAAEPVKDATDVDVSDLLAPAREVAAELGDRLSRDALLEGLRARGHSVGGRRRAAIYAAMQAERATTTTDVHPVESESEAA